VGFYALLFAGLLVVTFLLLEIVAHVLDPLGVSYYPKTAEYMDTMILEEPIGYRNRPNLEGTYYGVPVRINSLGLRDREIDLVSGDNEFRILVLGDSMPFGIGVKYEQSIPHQLEQVLEAGTAGSGWEFRTINGGTVSYNTEQELIQLQELGLRLRPRLVTLMYMENDIQPKMWVFDKRRAWYVRRIERSYAASLLAVVYKKLTGLGPVGRIEGSHRLDDPGWTRADAALTEINRLCREAGTPFVVFTLAPIPLVARVGEREGFPVVSLLEMPYWTSAGKRPEDFANSATDGHPNPEGSAVYARLMYEALADLDVLPAEPVQGLVGYTAEPRGSAVEPLSRRGEAERR